jgi:lipoate-protein ligase A
VYDSQLLANYLKISDILKASLEPFSVLFDQNASSGPQTAYADSSLCFAKALSYELTVGGKKLVGSAQRRWQKAVLQHGSILLGPCHEKLGGYLNVPPGEREAFTRQLRESTTFLRKFFPEPISLEEFSGHVKHSFETRYTVQMDPGNLSPEEEEAIQDLRKTFRIL